MKRPVCFSIASSLLKSFSDSNFDPIRHRNTPLTISSYRSKLVGSVKRSRFPVSCCTGRWDVWLLVLPVRFVSQSQSHTERNTKKWVKSGCGWKEFKRLWERKRIECERRMSSWFGLEKTIPNLFGVPKRLVFFAEFEFKQMHWILILPQNRRKPYPIIALENNDGFRLAVRDFGVDASLTLFLTLQTVRGVCTLLFRPACST